MIFLIEYVGTDFRLKQILTEHSAGRHLNLPMWRVLSPSGGRWSYGGGYQWEGFEDKHEQWGKGLLKWEVICVKVWVCAVTESGCIDWKEGGTEAWVNLAQSNHWTTGNFQSLARGLGLHPLIRELSGQVASHQQTMTPQSALCAVGAALIQRGKDTCKEKRERIKEMALKQLVSYSVHASPAAGVVKSIRWKEKGREDRWSNATETWFITVTWWFFSSYSYYTHRLFPRNLWIHFAFWNRNGRGLVLIAASQMKPVFLQLNS